MIIYYIYHLPNFVWKDGSIGKIGVSEKPKRRTKRQGYTDYEILEEHTCIYKVSDREIELQKEYGYKVDKIPYWKMRLNPTKEGMKKAGDSAKLSGQLKNASIKGGEVQGPKNVESGHLESIRTKESCSKGGKNGSKISNSKIFNCPHCGKEGKGRTMKRWHFDKCKHKPILT
jgi:predicted RNA-binding Zn-ribbon protein involved in translation (DUF1610 family)